MQQWLGGGMVVTNRTHWCCSNHWEILSDLVSWIKHFGILLTRNWRFHVHEIGDFMYMKLRISCTWNYMNYVGKITCIRLTQSRNFSDLLSVLAKLCSSSTKLIFNLSDPNWQIVVTWKDMAPSLNLEIFNQPTLT